MNYEEDKIWEKAIIVPGYNENIARMDCCGAWILRSDFGNRHSKFGWEIDHIYPQAKGGLNEIDNLRPMQWENNLAKGDDFPVYNAVVRAEGDDNIYYDARYKMSDELIKKLEGKYKRKV